MFHKSFNETINRLSDENLFIAQIGWRTSRRSERCTNPIKIRHEKAAEWSEAADESIIILFKCATVCVSKVGERANLTKLI